MGVITRTDRESSTRKWSNYVAAENIWFPFAGLQATWASLKAADQR